jgi:bifunctional ADP-heptose synthase (sugar kinase/adenylyltransferase)
MADENSVIDFAKIEQFKENIIPLKQGRSARQLVDIASSTSTLTSADLEKIRLDFEERIQLAEDLDDPLEEHLAYIKWIQQAFTQGNNSNSNLVSVIERTTKHFLLDPRYSNDPRYLRLWLLYANSSEEPVTIFRFLSANNIGVGLALYYEEYATLLYQRKR